MVEAPPHITNAVFEVWKRVGNKSRVLVGGWSMHPLIEDGDTALVLHTCKDVDVGTVIAFKLTKERIVVHRVLRSYLRRSKRVFICRGDNNLHLDPPLSEEMVIGRVEAVRKKSGKTIALDGIVQRWLGYTIVGCFELARKLPRAWTQIKVAKVFDRIAMIV